MKKKNIEFYGFEESKTEFLFESDAEKAVLAEAAKPKRKKLYKKIITNSLVLSVMIICGFYGLSFYENKELTNLSASAAKSNTDTTKTSEKMNLSSNELQIVSNNYNKKYEIIINKANPISESLAKSYNIVNVEENIYPNTMLEEETYKSYLKLKENLLERGYYLNIRSGYRSFEESEKVYKLYSVEKGESYAEKYVAKPGVSEHNIGIAFDFIISKDKNALKTNYESDEYFYLENIAYLYGFIIRYPKDKENITGYSYEPWHLRYVGPNLAKYLKKNNLTLEEYYETWEWLNHFLVFFFRFKILKGEMKK